ncbi:MAG: hypothetical protein M3N49_08470 [Candidatus Eremiobacteraeota bacterium]|nr:hypothetical protein [Candidatus Eremiobacteraeota bacterium]
MTRSWPSALATALLAVALLCACGRGGGGEHRDASEVSHPAKNPSDFPLYPRSDVVNVVPVDSKQMFAVMRANDPHAQLPDNYRGHVIIAETGATMPQLRSWLAALQSSPPSGFHDTTSHVTHSSSRGSHSSDGTSRVEFNGDDSAQFENANASRWVYVFTADPRQIYREMGPVFTLIDGYRAAPDFLRGPIDDTAKQQTGYTVTQMLDVKSPAGAVIAELKRLQSSDRRAILLIDEAKAK